jgi:ADP-ribose pyrophosphatase YjhB (NUDIX family)
MNYCSHCGKTVHVRVPEGDTLPRHVCDACGMIHYLNPKIVVGCIPEWQDRILLCRRAIEPRRGYWTLPAGFMENGETVQQGAARETLEEARAVVSVGALYALFNLPHISQVYMLFRARLTAPEFGAGAESLEVKLVREDEVPWTEIAFPVIGETLRLYYRDRSAGSFPLRCGEIVRRPGQGRRLETLVYDDG